MRLLPAVGTTGEDPLGTIERLDQHTAETGDALRARLSSTADVILPA